MERYDWQVEDLPQSRELLSMLLTEAVKQADDWRGAAPEYVEAFREYQRAVRASAAELGGHVNAKVSGRWLDLPGASWFQLDHRIEPYVDRAMMDRTAHILDCLADNAVENAKRGVLVRMAAEAADCMIAIADRIEAGIRQRIEQADSPPEKPAGPTDDSDREGQDEIPDVYVDLRQIAKMLHRAKDSLKPKHRKNWPKPESPHSGRSSNKWRWKELRPVLLAEYPHNTIPLKPPDIG